MPKAKHITVTVPHDFSIPEFYMEASAERVALALTLGAEAINHIEKHAAEAARSDTHDEAVKEVTREFERQATATTTKLKKAEEAARAANLRLEAMEADAANLRSQIQKDVAQTYEAILKAKDQQVHQAQAALDKAMDSVGRKVESLQTSMTKTYASSKEKGSMGEFLMEGHLKKAYDCDVHVVSKERESADIRMARGKADYLWEVKNYTRMVTNDEVEKFKRDLRLHPDVCGGILVSLRLGIVGKCRGGDIDVEFLEDGRFILYIGQFMAQDDPIFYLQTLRPFFDIVEATAKPVKEDAEAVRALEMKAALMTNLLRSHSSSVTKHRNALVGHKKRTDTMFAEFQGYIMEAEAQLNTILRVAMGNDETTAAHEAELSMALPMKIFKKEFLAEYADDRTRDFIKWLLTQVEAQEGSQIELKDLVERAQKATFSEKFVRGSREDVFEEAVWIKGARCITGLRWISFPTSL
jgi:hypothetical protein